ncbi:MAG: hypothetical protein A2086_00580 [Spirochaetes bacterium GWD1_27_9]|nr:MAG: hypothetical protein A2Z98_05090 [Spirochaetes bacterium GWB1_27_13]OHD25034.1 MAG: hypothetical protein A2Y34_03145 [Spirochaetes bacterium GWC1_27_15]OHD32505.1 MAG: hypothetical protein A2086_00580 [Spirochaetes bacterium GWD1_27_9]
MKKIIIIGVIVLVVIIISVILYSSMAGGASVAQFEDIKEPKINNKSSQKMLVIKGVGLTNFKNSFGDLFGAYYKIKNMPKDFKMQTPKSRWFADVNTSDDTWAFSAGVAIPDSINEVPQVKLKDGITLEIETWEYGEVAEVLHIGGYDKETPTIEKLINFIKQSGYEIAGPHEEEYVKGPMPFIPSDPNKYLTIIRYQVKKSEVKN